MVVERNLFCPGTQSISQGEIFVGKKLTTMQCQGVFNIFKDLEHQYSTSMLLAGYEPALADCCKKHATIIKNWDVKNE